MEFPDWLIVLPGIGLTIFVLTDVFLTVLHIDADGPLARRVFQTCWRLFTGLSRAFPAARRTLVAFAGPAMMVVTFLIWMILYITGFALIYWPYIESFRSEDQILQLGFIEALYFSGVTASVLGYGDITPLHSALRIVSILQSGLGFALLTGIVTYLINVVAGVSERNALALRLRTETDLTGDGVKAIIRSLEYEEPSDLQLRLQTLLDTMYSIHQKMHQFPILDLYYRSNEPAFSPELMIRTAAQMSIAVRLIATDPGFSRLIPTNHELGELTTDMMILISRQYLSKELKGKLLNPEPAEIDHRQLKRIAGLLRQTAPHLQVAMTDHEEYYTDALQLAFRLRVFLDEADRHTAWRMDHAIEDLIDY